MPKSSPRHYRTRTPWYRSVDWKPVGVCVVSALAISLALLGVVAWIVYSKPAAAKGDSLGKNIPVERPWVEVVVIGDSYTGGSGEGGAGPAGWPALVWNSLQSDGIGVEPEVSGRGGSGYVRRGTEDTVFPEEAARLVTADDDLVVFFGSVNDMNESIDSIAAAAGTAFGEVRAISPDAQLVVIGPAWPREGYPPEEVVQIRDVLRQEAEAAGATFIDPMSEGWLRDTPDLIGADGVHPNNAGHVYLAERIAPHLKDALEQMAGSSP